MVLKFVLSEPARSVRTGAAGRGSVDDEVPAAVQQKPSPAAVGRVAPRLPNSLLKYPLGLLGALGVELDVVRRERPDDEVLVFLTSLKPKV